MNILNLSSQPLAFVVWIGAVLLALTVHEFSHALMATILGDSTARRLGRLSLNPLAHIDWFGLLALVFVSFGWGKPVPYNPYELRYQKWGPFFIGLAGPFSNLILMTISGVLMRVLLPVLGSGNLLIIFLGLSFIINMAIMLFNLIPLPPLDGSKIIFAVLHKPIWNDLKEGIERYGSWVLMGLIFVDIALGMGIIGTILGVPFYFISGLFGLQGLLGV